MKAMHVALAFLTAIALTLLSVGGLEAETGAIHAGKGAVLSVDGAKGRLVMTEERGGTHVLFLDSKTKVIDAMGLPISAAALQPGDLVWEECLRVGNGTFKAKQIRLLRPTWMETASPEN